MDKQLTIDFKPSKYAGYGSLVEFIGDCVIPELLMSGSQYTHKKQIAADLDMSPSLLARKLSGNEQNIWSQSDTELFMKVTGSVEPAKYLAWTYLRQTDEEKDKEIEKLRKQLSEAQNAN